MKAMILAAGKGTRVQPLAYDVPKPMIPLIRKPVLASIIELLRQHSVDQIVINTSHLAPTIEDYSGTGRHSRPRRHRGSSEVGDGALIEGPTVIGPGSVIESGAEMCDCLVDHCTKITSVARLDRLIISHGHCIKPDGTFFSHRQADLGWLIDDARHLKRLSEDHNLLIQPARQADTEARRSP